jgi:Zn-dependent protease
MLNNLKRSTRLFQAAGIDVYLHWSWFVVAVYEIASRGNRYSSIVWNVLEYVGLFVIVLLHEFGHALACRQVGGRSDRIMLWPLGGVAHVMPPPRPGATLWSIAAGPLVNVALLPLLGGAFLLADMRGWHSSSPDVYRFLLSILIVDVILLAFNLLPVYPLDGGQIFRCLLWFIFGRGRSLMITTILSFFGVAGVLFLAAWQRSILLVAVAVFMLMSCWKGLTQARAILRAAKAPRRAGVACPSCHSSPFLGPRWICDQCSSRFDPFETSGACPACSAPNTTTQCPDCHQRAPMDQWLVSDAPPVAALQTQP